MAKKEFLFKGKSAEELKAMSVSEYAKLIPSRLRRSLSRGFDVQQKSLLKKLEQGKNNVKTHSRDLAILPLMIGKTIKVYNGKEFVDVRVTTEKLGHMLGDFAMTRKHTKHSSPGVGASKSSKSASVR